MATTDKHLTIIKLTGFISGIGFGVLVMLSVLSAYYPHSGLREIFVSICHQQPDRSYCWGQEPFGLCIRCFWLYVGLSTGHLRFSVWTRIPAWRRAFLIWTGCAITLNWILGWFGAFPADAIFRGATGFLFGLAISNYSQPGITEWFLSKSTTPPTKQPYELIRP